MIKRKIFSLLLVLAMVSSFACSNKVSMTPDVAIAETLLNVENLQNVATTQNSANEVKENNMKPTVYLSLIHI